MENEKLRELCREIEKLLKQEEVVGVAGFLKCHQKRPHTPHGAHGLHVGPPCSDTLITNPPITSFKILLVNLLFKALLILGWRLSAPSPTSHPRTDSMKTTMVLRTIEVSGDYFK